MTNGFTRKALFVSLLALFMFTTLSTAAFADQGNALPLVFDDGGSVVGSFTFTQTGATGFQTLGAFSFTVSGGTDTVFGPSFTYDNADTDMTASSFFIDAGSVPGTSIGILDLFSPSFTGRPRRNLAITFEFVSPLAVGSGATVCTGPSPCLDAGGFNIPSGEQFLDANGNETIRDITGGGFTITDDPGVFSFNSNPAPLFGTTGNGGGTTVPEPSSLVLLGVGIVGFALCRRNRVASM